MNNLKSQRKYKEDSQVDPILLHFSMLCIIYEI